MKRIIESKNSLGHKDGVGIGILGHEVGALDILLLQNPAGKDLVSVGNREVLRKFGRFVLGTPNVVVIEML